MHQSGYYEIVNHTEDWTGLKMSVIAGNVLFNRLHWHDSLEIFCCIHGSVHLNVQGESFALEAGDLVTVNCGRTHELSEGTPDGLQLIFSVDPSLLRNAEGQQYLFYTVGEGALPRDDPDIAAVRAAIARLGYVLSVDREMLETFAAGRLRADEPRADEPRTDELRTDELRADQLRLLRDQAISDASWYQLHRELYHILMYLSGHKEPAAGTAVPTGPMDRFIRCVEIIHSDYARPLTAGGLAEEIGFSEPTIYRLFQKHMGVSFNHYLNSVRISAACGMMDDSRLSMTEIAAQCGFLSLSNFYRAFHQFAGMSPRDYRRYRGVDRVGSRGLQRDIMMQNRFQPLWELPYGREELRRLGAMEPCI